MTDPASDEILVHIRNRIAHLTLNRPKALNALSHDMVRQLAALLEKWKSDDNVKAIVVRGAGEKSFCAGGDIRALYEAGKRGDGSEQEFFREEYALNFNIHRYLADCGKPYIAWIDGIVMGGGMGISQGAPIRIVGDRTKMAMPETSIGLFPDVGGSYFLSRCPGAIGLYLGLTGQTIRAADALYAGLATHYIASGAAFEFDFALDNLVDWSQGPLAAALDIVGKFARQPVEPAVLPPLRDAIQQHFANKKNVADIVASLAGEIKPDHIEWAQNIAGLLRKKSPTMLEVTKRQIERAATMSLADCFRMEMDLVTATFEHGDVVEGIRALLIDKDQSPNWRPASLAEVRDQDIDAFFRPRWNDATHPLAHLPASGSSAGFGQSLRVFRSDNAKALAAGLFREAFNCDFPAPAEYRIADTPIHPADWHQYVAMYTWPDGTEECVGFCNWIKYKDVYLEGGMAVQARFYRRLDSVAFAECSARGGVAQIMMETAAKELTDCVAWFGHCGDKRALRVDMRAGFVQTDDPHLIVKWMQPVGQPAKQAWIVEIKSIGPF